MKTEKFKVTGMTCSACSGHVEKAVAKVVGVEKVTVNLLANNMAVTFDDKKTNESELMKSVVDAGYGASAINQEKSNTQKNGGNVDNIAEELKSMKNRLMISIVFLTVLMYISMGSMVSLPLPAIFLGHANALTFGLTQLLLTLPILYVNRNYFIIGFKMLFKLAPNMDSLIAIGATAAFGYSTFAVYAIGYGLGHGNMELVGQYHMDLYFESAAMILTLITVGKFLESRAKGKTSDAIGKLLDLAPKTAVVLTEMGEKVVPIEEVAVGDILVVKQGSRIPVDGIVTEGNGAVDEGALTGESMPVEKTVGSPVIGATINLSGYFKMKATKVLEDTTLWAIVALVEDASASKAPIAKLADKVSGVFVPVVIGISIVSTIVWMILGKGPSFAISIGIAVLVISCPCALGLATPTAIMVGTGKGAQNGILIKTAQSLETLHTIKTVVLDKTGTVTEGKPQVTELLPVKGTSPMELLIFGATMEEKSEHPLAVAIVKKGKEEGVKAKELALFEAVAGQGVKGFLDGKACLAGNEKMMTLNGIDIKEQKEQAQTLGKQGKTVLYFARENRLIGMIAVADVIKKTSKQAIKEFEKMGIEVVMLTGDNEQTAKAIGAQLGISNVVFEVMPQDKEAVVRGIQEQGKRVAMVGDGINDAPALARSDVGIAIGAGTEIAIESADIVLMKSDLLDAVAAIQLSKAVIRNIKQNLFWAFFYNVIGIPLAAGVFFSILGWKLNPMFGAAAMSLSSVCVVSNALRLKLFQPSFQKNKNKKEVVIKDLERIEEKNMKKVIKIEGMMCGHCTGTVEKALKNLAGVEDVVMSLEEKTATVTLGKEVLDETLQNAVTAAGYAVISIESK